MTVFGFGRVLDTSPNFLEGRLYGTGRTFTLGFAEDHTLAEDVILASSQPLTIQTDIPGPDPVVLVSDDFSALASEHLRACVSDTLRRSADRAGEPIHDGKGR